MTSPGFRIRPFPRATLTAVKTNGRDLFGTPVQRLTAEGGEPLRCCLRIAVPGEECLLFGFEPEIPGTESP